MNYQEVMEWISSFGKSGAPVKNLNRIDHLLDKIYRPQEGLKFIHVAGTNGKGSVVAYIAAALRECGYKVGTFTSPYIMRYNDRICVNGVEIPDAEVAYLGGMLRQFVESKEYSQFELSFAIALLWFKEQRCDFVILEAGIGGLLDATNIIEDPVATVLTSISFDHVELLGKTLEEIATQKVGIFKKNAPAILSLDQQDSVVAVAEKRARELGITLYRPKQPEINEITLDYCSFQYEERSYNISMGGAYQIQNAITALTVIEALRNECGLSLSHRCVQRGIVNAKIVSRFSKIKGFPIYLEGAHNVSAMRYVADAIRKEKNPPYVLLGMLKNKDWRSTASVLQGLKIQRLFCVEDFTKNVVDGAEVAAMFPDTDTCVSRASVAYNRVRRHCLGEERSVFVIGSLYLTSYCANLEEEIKKKESVGKSLDREMN